MLKEWISPIKRQRRLKWSKTSYRDLVHFKLPKSTPTPNRRRKITETSARDNLYPVKIVQKEGDKVKIHYIGYGKKYDEWKDQCDVELITGDEVSQCESAIQEQDELPVQVYKPYSLYNDLSVRIKKAIICSRTGSPKVKIIMPFDVMMFNGGIKMAGRPIKKITILWD